MASSRLLRRVARYGLAALLCFGLISPLAAQTTGLTDFFGGSTGNPLQQLRQRLANPTLTETLVLEGALDPAQYLVGPGDQFSITIGGPQPLTVVVPVSADGVLVIPDGGALPVAGETLATATAAAHRLLQEQYQNVAVTVALAQPRQFLVHVTGAVPVPGRYPAAAAARASDILEQAFLDTTRFAVSNLAFRPALRSITLIHRDGATTEVDLIRYFTTGETAHNPYLRDGDVVHVPAYDPAHESIYVNGAVPFAGAYDYRRGDTVLDALLLGTGDTTPEATGTIRLVRTGADGRITAQTFAHADLLSTPEAAPRLQPRDHVYLTPAQPPGGTISVSGEVVFPGIYPIEQGQTTLRDLVAQAGGLRDEALLHAAYVDRMPAFTPVLPLLPENRFAPTPALPTLPPDSLGILHSLRQTNLDFFGRYYFTRTYNLQSRVAVNLTEALADGAATVYLQDGDRLVIPRDEGTVFVFGQVDQPGYLDFDPTRDVADYIALAGGKGPDAGNVFLIEAGTGRRLDASTHQPRSGDLIFVESKRRIVDNPSLAQLAQNEARNKADARIRIAQVASQIISATTSLLALIIALRRN